MPQYHIAQVNIGRIGAPLDDEIMAGFVRRLDEINALADRSLWWTPAGYIPGIDEAKKRLAHLDAHGPTEFAFTFEKFFPPDDAFQNSLDWAGFAPCPAG